jgi:membrane-bound lytic murein transglycosylase MltF
MHHTRLTAVLLFHTILAVLLISINPTETRAIGSDLELGKKWSGDFDGMAERHLIRALVPPSKTFYFLDGADQRGLTYELLKEFETYLNKQLKRNALVEKEFQRFKGAVGFFKRYSQQYNFDWLMIAAQAYQESGIDQSKRSPAGAIGVMQLLPSTAADPNVNIRKIEVMEHNIHAGVKHLRFLYDRYFKNEPMDALNKMLFAFASYNAGPGKVIELRQEAQQSGFNPNVWFRNVEIIASRRIGRETVQYVSNIYKYYIAYRLIVKEFRQKKEEKTRAN